MFSVFNDKINQKILVADVNGFITEYEYNATSSSLLNSAEGSMATDNFNDAKESDDNQDPPSDLTPAQDLLKVVRQWQTLEMLEPILVTLESFFIFQN